MGAQERFPLEWIDEYVANLRDFVVVRETDSLLIKVPNEAYRLNTSGVRTMRYMLGGGSVLELWRSAGGTDAVRRDIYTFFISLKQTLQGCLNERRLPGAVEVKPFALGFSTLPILSEVALTYRCNLACQFCYAGCTCSRRDAGGREMTTEEAKRILRIVAEDAEAPSVSFTGGEPTLREDLEELVSYARLELGLRVNLITNGSLIDRARARRLVEAGLHSAQVSLEGPDSATHDALTRSRGSFDRTVAGVRALKELGVHVHTNTTINRVNFETAAGMPAFAKSMGIDRFSMNMVIPTGASVRERPEIAVRYEEMPMLLDSILAEAERAGVEFMWYSPTPVCIFNPVPRRLGNKGCSACDGLLSVSPTGEVLPCSSWAEPVGNLLTQGFRDVWDSVRGKWLRGKAFAPAICKRCGDFALCQGACPLYWAHFGCDELKRYGECHVASAG